MPAGRWVALLGIVLLCGTAFGADEIDWNRARELHRRFTSGESLTKDERAYLERARAERAARKKRETPDGGQQAKSSTGMKPLTEMTQAERYKGESGGLYGDGKNTPPEGHMQAALERARRIQPLDAQGRPSPTGKIVLISVGMSNTTQEFSRFQQLAAADDAIAPQLVIVDGAQGGMDAQSWSEPGRGRNPWETLDRRLRQAGVTPAQVQVAWIKQARRGPAALGEYPRHADELRGHMETILHELQKRFPNLRIAYLSSRIYAGYATTPLNPEPYAYESAFAVRRLIQDQIAGRPALNVDPQQGAVKSPLLLWGPYLWADGVQGRKADRLVWNREDLAADGTHPSPSGRQKVAEQLLTFFKTDPTARPWFGRQSSP